MRWFLITFLLTSACSEQLDERIGALSDDDIARLCDTHPNRTPTRECERTKANCIIDVANMRTRRPCLLTEDVKACVGLDDACAVGGGEPECDIDCPDTEQCWTSTLEDCRTDDATCTIRRGAHLDTARGCYEDDQPAYCQPGYGGGCDDAPTDATDPDGGCWYFASICEVPDGWENRFGGIDGCTMSIEDPNYCD